METLFDELVDSAAQVTSSLANVAVRAATAATDTSKNQFSEYKQTLGKEASSSWGSMLPSLWQAAQNEHQRLLQQRKEQKASTPRRRPFLVSSQPPSSLDLVYITDRIIASSEPTPAPLPTYDDVGRDDNT